MVAVTPKSRNNSWLLPTCQVWFICDQWFDLKPLRIHLCVEWDAMFCTFTVCALCPSDQLIALARNGPLEVYQWNEQMWVWLRVESLVDQESNDFRLSHELSWIQKWGSTFSHYSIWINTWGIYLSHELILIQCLENLLSHELNRFESSKYFLSHEMFESRHLSRMPKKVNEI